MLSDLDLVQLATTKDPAGLVYVYDKYAPALYGCILKQCDDVATADMILEESFKKIWLRLGNYSSLQTTIFCFMLSITLQQCRDSEQLVRTSGPAASSIPD